MGLLALKASRVDWIGSTVSESAPMFAWPKKNLLFVGLLMFGAALAEGAVADWAAIFMTERFALTEAMALGSFMLFSFAMFLVAEYSQMVSWTVMELLASVVLVDGSRRIGIQHHSTRFGYSIVLVGFLLLGLGLAPYFPWDARAQQMTRL